MIGRLNVTIRARRDRNWRRRGWWVVVELTNGTEINLTPWVVGILLALAIISL